MCHELPSELYITTFFVHFICCYLPFNFTYFFSLIGHFSQPAGIGLWHQFSWRNFSGERGKNSPGSACV